MFMLQQKRDMNLYSFNKASWCTGYDNKGQYRMLMQGLEIVARHPISELKETPRIM